MSAVFFLLLVVASSAAGHRQTPVLQNLQKAVCKGIYSALSAAPRDTSSGMLTRSRGEHGGGESEEVKLLARLSTSVDRSGVEGVCQIDGRRGGAGKRCQPGLETRHLCGTSLWHISVVQKAVARKTAPHRCIGSPGGAKADSPGQRPGNPPPMSPALKGRDACAPTHAICFCQSVIASKDDEKASIPRASRAHVVGQWHGVATWARHAAASNHVPAVRTFPSHAIPIR